MRSIQSTLSSDEGFTLMELLVTTFLGLVVISLTLGSVTANRNVLARDTVRTRLNQDLRSSLDIIGADTRIAGENLNSSFPAVLITDGGAQPDSFVARRNLLDEVLKVCIAITAGSTATQVYFAVPGTTQGCIYSDQTHNRDVWQAYRLAEGGRAQAFIFNSVSKQGEFFPYVSEGDNGSSYWLNRTAGSWQYSYPVGSSAVYILEEWEYRVTNNSLQVVQNRDVANALNVSFGIRDFQVQATLSDGTTRTSFTTADSWSSITNIQFALTGTDSFRGRPINRTVTAQFFPRNILSH